ncbi:MAG: hypothetical protein ACJAUW_001630, partial [Yoonia sp.]
PESLPTLLYEVSGNQALLPSALSVTFLNCTTSDISELHLGANRGLPSPKMPLYH